MSFFSLAAGVLADQQGAVPPPAPPPPASPITVAWWDLSETSGDFADSVGAITMTATGAVEYNLGALVSGGDASAALNGTDARLTAPSASAWRVSEGSIALRFQVDAFNGGQQILVAMDSGSPPGGLSIEVFNSGLYAYTRKPGGGSGSAWWLGTDGSSSTRPGTPLATLVAGDAYLVALTCDGVETALWLWHEGDAAPSNPIATSDNTEWLVGNTSQLAIGSWHTAVALFNGVLDEIRIWTGVIGSSEISALGAPVSITHGDSAPPAFTCLARTITLADKHKDAGTIDGTAPFMNLDEGPTRKWDFTGTIRETHFIGGVWDGKRCTIRCDGNNGAVDQDDSCVSGGAFICPEMTADLNWNSVYQSSNGPTGFISVREITAPDMLWEGQRIHGGFDGYQTGSGTRNSVPRTIIRKWAATLMRDDAIEDDNWTEDLLVDDCYIESMVFYSNRNTGFDGSGRTHFIRNNIVRAIPIRIDNVPDRTLEFFKLNSNSVRLEVVDNIFAAEQNTYTGGGDPFGDLKSLGKLINPSGNVLCCLNGYTYPHTLPSGFTKLTGSEAQDFWDDAVAAWWDIFPGHRFAFDPPAP